VQGRTRKTTAAQHNARGDFGGGATWSGEGGGCDVGEVAQTGVVNSEWDGWSGGSKVQGEWQTSQEI
jgi:hypothetical protein